LGRDDRPDPPPCPHGPPGVPTAMAASMPCPTVHPFFAYTAEVLSWRLGRQDSPAPAPAPTPQQTQSRVGRLLRARQAGAGRSDIVLLGLGSGDLAAALAARLPSEAALTVVSLDPEAARSRLAAGRLPWLGPASPCRLLADASPQAVCQLLFSCGFSPQSALVTVNPESAAPSESHALALLRRLLTASRWAAPPNAPPDAPPKPTLALLARPDEPRLEEFFAAAQGLAGQAVIVWDAATVPAAAEQARALEIPVRHLARPLDGDFAAQRNAMLESCPPGWVLSLDPDERPGPGFRASLARIMAAPGLGAAYFPRLTLYPDHCRAKVGHGLWPDWQLRLYRTGPPGSPHYARALHERLEGATGRTGLALDAPILHFNRLVADQAAVSDKLAAFSRLPGAAAHQLSADYPTLPLEFFTTLAPPDGQERLLLLPEQV